MTSDENLMLQFQAGSREAFEELFARYRDSLYAFFRRRLPTQGAAEDLAQETWVAVLKGRVKYEPRAPFRSYLYAIAFKMMLSERRKMALHARASAQNGGLLPSGPESDHWVREALSKLDATEREMLLLREYEQLSYAEIAKLLNIPVNTVRSRLFRARLAIKQLLEPDSAPAASQGRL